MECGHYTTVDEQDFYAVFAPRHKGKERKMFCDKHSKWYRVAAAPKKEPIPSEPMF
jgi:hypothetical protein